jgi:hypothetical protein
MRMQCMYIHVPVNGLGHGILEIARKDAIQYRVPSSAAPDDLLSGTYRPVSRFLSLPCTGITYVPST